MYAETAILGFVIYGGRVRLRRIERSDLPRFASWLNDPEVRDGLAAFYPMSLAQEEAWFESNLKLEPASQPFALEARVGGADFAHIGGLGFHQIDWRNRTGEVGIFIGEKALWGRGFGTEAMRALVAWGFQELNLHRVQLRVYEDNARAIRSYEKLGFKLEGRLRQDRFHQGRYFDTLMMGLLRGELAG